MSQAGKVLHLYVEVRSFAEEEERMLERGDHGRGHRTLQCPDILPLSQRSSTHSSPNCSPDLSPDTQTHIDCGNHSVPSSKTSSRHSVSFHLENPDTTGSPTQYHRHDVLCNDLAQLLQVISPARTGLGSYSSDVDHYQERVPISPSSTPSGMPSVSTTPTSNRRSCEVTGLGNEEGKTSVVSFGYIEKSNVDCMGSQSPRVCQTESKGKLLNGHLYKRLSDPLWHIGLNHSDPSLNQSPQGSPHLKRATQDAVIREEELRSPELRRHFAGHGPETYSPTLPWHYQPPRCRSLGGSPVLPRNILTLPSKIQLSELDRGMCCSSVNRIPRSPASNHLCAHTGFYPHSLTPITTQGSHSLPHRQQNPWSEDESPRLTCKFHPPLPAGRPTDIQHEIPTRIPSNNSQPKSDYQTRRNSHFCVKSSYNAMDSKRYSAYENYNFSGKSHHKPLRCCSRTSDAASPTSGRRSVSPPLNPEVVCKLAADATRLSTVLADRRTPSPTPSQAESLRSVSPNTGGSFQRESQPCATLQVQHSPEPLQEVNQTHQWKTVKPTQSVTRQGRVPPPPLSQTGIPSPASPALPARLHRAGASQVPMVDPRQQWSSSPSKAMSVLHRYQLPQYTGDRKSAGVEWSHYDKLSERSSLDKLKLPKRLLSSQNTNVRPMSWTARQEVGPVLCNPSKEDNCGRDREDKGFTMLVQRNQSSELREEVQDHSRAVVTSSQSSSGVTGSIGDSSQLFPETLSQSSHDTADTGSGIQVGWRGEWSGFSCVQTENVTDGSLTAVTTSLRSQKIARAKWEFLFGRKTEEDCCSKDTSPTSGSSSPTPPSSPSSFSSSSNRKTANQRRGREGEDRKVSHHKVRKIEVELVSPDLRGSNPKTGVIRRTIKYSETDLDAVPLRCYRETDLDEVMRAEAEEVEVDSAFGSHRSVQGNCSFSPTDVSPKPRTRGGRGGGEEEDEEEEEERVVSWASVGILGDKQRQRAAKEEDELFSLMLKGSSEASCDANSGLKSPISIGSPRRPSDSNMDSFSRHFENIMESHRAKGTSYSSLDSVDLLTSGSTSVFTFDLPTLTPEIQSQICDGAKEIIELSFAPLARPDPAASSETSRSDIALSASVGGLRGGAKEDCSPPVRTRSQKDPCRRSNSKDGFRKTNSAPSLHSSPRERQVNRPLELLYPQADVAERLACGGSDDALTNGTKADLQAAKRLAKRLYHLDGFRKSDVSRHLSKNNEFSQKVAEEYLRNFNFSGLTIDQALRLFLTHFALMGETQERERVLSHFSKRYRDCNSTDNTEDSVHTLTCAVMLLNSDLHGNNLGKRMSCSQFISNLEGLNNGRDFPKDLLKTLYSSIKNEKLQWTIDEEELRKSMSELADVRTDSASHTMKRLGSGGNPLVGVAQQADGELYKSGFLVRKVHADPDGKRTPRGKRGWKSFYAMLKGLVLYLQKDEYRMEGELTDEDMKNTVSIHHSLAMRAVDYSKRPNVFYLRTADWRVFLFQAPNAEQMQSWITRINVVAAMFSAPPFPAAIGSQKRFSRPLLPGSNTKLSQEEQVKSHENRFRAVSSELAELLTASSDHKVKGRELEEHNLRQEYLEFEKTRYGTYAMLLRAKLSSGDEDLVAFESRLFDDGGLQRAHSSPLLPQDASGKEKTRGTKMSKSLKVTSSSLSSTMKSGDDSGEEVKKKNDNNAQPELHKPSAKQERAP